MIFPTALLNTWPTTLLVLLVEKFSYFFPIFIYMLFHFLSVSYFHTLNFLGTDFNILNLLLIRQNNYN